MASFTKFYAAIGYEYKDESLAKLALTHRSKSAEHNERLEFLGDSLLNFIMAAKLYQRFPLLREGDLSRIRAGLVNGETLGEIARELKIGVFLRLGVGEKKSGGDERTSILANAMEAIIGSIYLDTGIKKCEQVVLNWYKERLKHVPNTAQKKDPKTTLQEYLQAQHLPLPDYHVEKITGQSHAQVFYVVCRVDGLPHQGKGKGTSRRRAEQQAATKLLKLLRIE